MEQLSGKIAKEQDTMLPDEEERGRSKRRTLDPLRLQSRGGTEYPQGDLKSTQYAKERGLTERQVRHARARGHHPGDYVNLDSNKKPKRKDISPLRLQSPGKTEYPQGDLTNTQYAKERGLAAVQVEHARTRGTHPGNYVNLDSNKKPKRKDILPLRLQSPGKTEYPQRDLTNTQYAKERGLTEGKVKYARARGTHPEDYVNLDSNKKPKRGTVSEQVQDTGRRVAETLALPGKSVGSVSEGGDYPGDSRRHAQRPPGQSEQASEAGEEAREGLSASGWEEPAWQSRGTGTTDGLKRALDPLTIEEGPASKREKIADVHQELEEVLGQAEELRRQWSSSEESAHPQQNYQEWRSRAELLEGAIQERLDQEEGVLQDFETQDELRRTRDLTWQSIEQETAREAGPSGFESGFAMSTLQERYKDVQLQLQAVDHRLRGKEKDEVKRSINQLKESLVRLSNQQSVMESLPLSVARG